MKEQDDALNKTDLIRKEAAKLLLDPVYLRETMLHLTEIIREKDEVIQSRERELEALAPVKDFYDRVTESEDWMEMSAVAKVLGYKGWGRNNIFKLLKERQVLRYNNEPYQKYIERGYFKVIEQVFTISNGETMVNRKTMVSQKGLDFIRKLIEEEIAA